jgi:hypothetical protein
MEMSGNLPPELMNIVRDFLMPSKEQHLILLNDVLTDIKLYGDIVLPHDNYRMYDLMDYINMRSHCLRRYTAASDNKIYNEIPDDSSYYKKRKTRY